MDEDGCNFRLWARPNANIELVLESEQENKPSRVIPMTRQQNGMYETHVEGVKPGTLYWFKIDGTGPFPDPASRYQPFGVHGPSQVVGPSKFLWETDDFKVPSLRNLVIYELHVGTFTPDGTFLSVIEKLDSLRQLGINAIELMPIADFAGEYNWGYDGVSLYAPSHSYGTPDDLRELVLQAHRHGIAVFLDVVYNHLGPDGAYHSTFAPRFYSGKHKTPWGDGLNFDGEGREKVRAYFIESALMWIHDYHVDGFRLDATDRIQDDSTPHFLAELTERVHAAVRGLGKKIIIVAEDARNERKIVLPREQDGFGFDAVWSDDFHHHLRHRLAGDSDGYYRDFSGDARDIAETIQNGWFFTGQFARHWEHSRGTSPDGLSLESRLFCIQNHDQIGNRAFGDRLSSEISRAAFYAASALLLLVPEIPLIFMGQEWAAPEPFLFFTNHHDELGRSVTEGRRKEFEHFSIFGDETKHGHIPDPQARETFMRSKLNWKARESPDGAACLRWYKKLLSLRRKLVAAVEFQSSQALNDKTIVLQWGADNGMLLAIIALEGPVVAQDFSWREMKFILSSEDQSFTSEPHLASWNSAESELRFQRAGAIILAKGELALDLGSERG